MAASGFERSLVYILIFIGEFFADSGISIDLVVGVLVTVSVLLLIALLVTCLITWKRKTDKLMSLLKFRSRAMHIMPFRKNTNVRNTSELKESTKKQKLKKNLSRSTTNLNNNTEKKGMSKSASCSALDLPLPSEPGCKKSKDKSSEQLKPPTRTATIYDEDFQASIMLKENAAYGDNMLASVSVSAMVDKINKGPEQEEGHEYEQLEMVAIKDCK